MGQRLFAVENLTQPLREMKHAAPCTDCPTNRFVREEQIRTCLLTDRAMEADAKLLSKQFTQFQGLQTTLVSHTSFKPIEENGSFVAEGKRIPISIKWPGNSI